MSALEQARERWGQAEAIEGSGLKWESGRESPIELQGLADGLDDEEYQAMLRAYLESGSSGASGTTFVFTTPDWSG